MNTQDGCSLAVFFIPRKGSRLNSETATQITALPSEHSMLKKCNTAGVTSEGGVHIHHKILQAERSSAISDGSTPGQVRSFSAGAVSPRTSVTVLPSDPFGQKGQDYDKEERYCELQWRTAYG